MLNPFKNSIYITCDAFAYAILGFYVYRFCWIKDGLEMAMHISYFSLSIKCRVGNLLRLFITEPVEVLPKFVAQRMNYCHIVMPAAELILPRDINVWLQYFQIPVVIFSLLSTMFLCHISNTIVHDIGVDFLLHCSGMLWCMLFQNHFCKIYGHTISWWRCTRPFYT